MAGIDVDQGRRLVLMSAALGATALASGCGPRPAGAGRAGPALPLGTSAGTGRGRSAATVVPTSLGSPAAADWKALRQRLSTHRLVRPGEHGYRLAHELFDPRFDSLRPLGIAYCSRPADVAECLSFVRRFRLPVRARSGGHSYAGWSSVTGGLVIDISPMRSVSFGYGTVRVGSGIGLIDFYNALAARGVAVPGGSCPTVGIAGLALGGGVGVLGRQFGLTSDNLEAIQIVTASGDTLDCDSHHHTDLYWASQGGGGGNFGVATSLTFRTHPLQRLVLFFLSWPWSSAGNVVRAWQSWAPYATDALWSNMHLYAATGGSPQISVGGTYVGAIDQAAQHLDDLYALVGSQPSSSFLQDYSYLDAMLVEAGCSGLSVPGCHTAPDGRLSRVPQFAKSDFFIHPLSASGITALLSAVEQLGSVPGARGGSGSVAFDAFGGALNRPGPDATAFAHRDALFLVQYITDWTSPGSGSEVARQHAWLRSTYSRLHPHASGQAYQNYIDPDLKNWQWAYYGANYPRLQRVKARYDPHWLFRFPQAITPA